MNLHHSPCKDCWLVGFMVFNASFNNILFLSWQSILFVEELEDPEKTNDLLPVTDKLYHIMLYTLPWVGVEPTTSVVIGTDWIGSCKSKYHTTMTMTPPPCKEEFINYKCIKFKKSDAKSCIQSGFWLKRLYHEVSLECSAEYLRINLFMLSPMS
jgi:hypothetical protein